AFAPRLLPFGKPEETLRCILRSGLSQRCYACTGILAGSGNLTCGRKVLQHGLLLRPALPDLLDFLLPAKDIGRSAVDLARGADDLVKVEVVHHTRIGLSHRQGNLQRALDTYRLIRPAKLVQRRRELDAYGTPLKGFGRL